MRCMRRAYGSGGRTTSRSSHRKMVHHCVETLLGNRDTPIEWEGFTPYDKLPPRARPPP